MSTKTCSDKCTRCRKPIEHKEKFIYWQEATATKQSYGPSDRSGAIICGDDEIRVQFNSSKRRRGAFCFHCFRDITATPVEIDLENTLFGYKYGNS